MDKRIQRLRTTEECKRFEFNALRLNHPELALQTKLRSLEIRADEKGATNQVEREALQAVFAYEQVLSAKNGKPTRASRTWPMIKKYGIVGGVEKVVDRVGEAAGYKVLTEMGLEHFAFEAVILRHPEAFSEDAIKISEKRMAAWANG